MSDNTDATASDGNTYADFAAAFYAVSRSTEAPKSLTWGQYHISKDKDGEMTVTLRGRGPITKRAESSNSQPTFTDTIHEEPEST